MIRSAYAEVFKLTDPSKDDAQRVKDAFRLFKPEAQRDRQVMLFMGLCKHAGIIQSIPREPRGLPGSNPKPRPKLSGEPKPRGGAATIRSGQGIPASIMGVLDSLPLVTGTWPEGRKKKFLTAFEAILDMEFEIKDEDASEGGDDNEQ